MLFTVYSVLDSVAGEYSPLFQAVNDGVALRSFKSMMSSVDNVSDYRLYSLGTIDSSNGCLVVSDAREVVIEDHLTFEKNAADAEKRDRFSEHMAVR
jgi:hypothetical protein